MFSSCRWVTTCLVSARWEECFHSFLTPLCISVWGAVTSFVCFRAFRLLAGQNALTAETCCSVSEPSGAHRDAAVLQRRGSSSPGCGVFFPVLSGGDSGARQGPVQGLSRTGRWRSCPAEEKDLCPCVTRKCSWYISEMPAGRVAVWSLLSRSGHLLLQSKAGEYREPVFPQGIFTYNS